MGDTFDPRNSGDEVSPTARPRYRRRNASYIWVRTIFLRHEWLRGYGLLLPALLSILLLMCLPFGMVVMYSFWSQHNFEIVKTFTLANYLAFTLKPVFSFLLVKSISIAICVTLLVLLLAYPVAYFIAFKVQTYKILCLMLVTLPFWTSYLLRVFAWKVVLGFNGLINSALINLGVIETPISILLHSWVAVVITLAHAWVAFAILPIYVSLQKIDRSLLEAAADLGDTPWQSFRYVVWPLSIPGVIAAGIVISVPVVGDFVTPALVGGTSGMMIANMMEAQFKLSNNWPMGSAISVVLMLLIIFIWCLIIFPILHRRSFRK